MRAGSVNLPSHAPKANSQVALAFCFRRRLIRVMRIQRLVFDGFEVCQTIRRVKTNE